MPIWYNFFCDETGTHTGVFHIGGLKMTPPRSQKLSNSLRNFKISNGLRGELKWNKVNESYLKIYISYVDLFFKESAPVFKAMKVIKGQDWRKFGRNENERFFKSYYVFFMRMLGCGDRFNLFLDQKKCKLYAWKQLSFALNGSLGGNFRTQRTIKSVNPVDSKTNDIIQLSDILLGSIAFQGNSDSAKGTLSNHVRSKMEASTKYGSPYFEIKTFKPNRC